MVIRTPPRSGSPERDVIRLLAEQDGWTWQGHIEVELDHPAPQVRRLLDGMEAEGRIERRDVDRSKIVMLPGREPGYLDELSSREG